MTLTVSELGVLLLLAFVTLHYLRALPKARALCGFLGVMLIGTAGFAGDAISDSAMWLQAKLGLVTAWVFGVAVTGPLVVVLFIILMHDLHPKKQASRRTGLIAVVLGAVIAVGVAGVPMLAGVDSGVTQFAGQVVTTLNGVH